MRVKNEWRNSTIDRILKDDEHNYATCTSKLLVY